MHQGHLSASTPFAITKGNAVFGMQYGIHNQDMIGLLEPMDRVTKQSKN